MEAIVNSCLNINRCFAVSSKGGTHMEKKIFSHTNEREEEKSNGEKFMNVCIGIATIGTMVFPYLQHYLG
jgi:hypothetical protein